MNRQSDIGCVATHFDSQSDFRNQVTRIGSDDSGTYYAVAFRVEQNFGESLVAPDRQ